MKFIRKSIWFHFAAYTLYVINFWYFGLYVWCKKRPTYCRPYDVENCMQFCLRKNILNTYQLVPLVVMVSITTYLIMKNATAKKIVLAYCSLILVYLLFVLFLHVIPTS
ncbi:hypothetical protein COU76_05030 [Candidatus Peregrinibacteria bacterium CG10_big_fil_rev_8_21_14_0_10_49_10]|nr:MAG: hypothetical protein COU76_05030 [Candidatus Peregrinibacteria bacterium CG10_big_fil_rev_8_21_14_0_10_49_10]